MKQVNSATSLFSEQLKPTPDQAAANICQFLGHRFNYCNTISQSGGLPLIRREKTVSSQHFQQRSCLLWILFIDEGLAVYTFSVPCLQCLYNSQLPQGQSVTWFKEAANAKDIIEKHSIAIKRRQLGEKVEEKVLKGGWRIHAFCRTRYIHSSMVQKHLNWVKQRCSQASKIK